MLGKIASLIGKPCYIDKLTASRERIAYARVLVELKSGEKMIDKIVLHGVCPSVWCMNRGLCSVIGV